MNFCRVRWYERVGFDARIRALTPQEACRKVRTGYTGTGELIARSCEAEGDLPYEILGVDEVGNVTVFPGDSRSPLSPEEALYVEDTEED